MIRVRKGFQQGALCTGGVTIGYESGQNPGARVDGDTLGLQSLPQAGIRNSIVRAAHMVAEAMLLL